jgi:hypothetical protein
VYGRGWVLAGTACLFLVLFASACTQPVEAPMSARLTQRYGLMLESLVRATPAPSPAATLAVPRSVENPAPVQTARYATLGVARRYAAFSIREPVRLPVGLAVREVVLYATSVDVFYAPTGSGSGSLRVHQQRGRSDGGIVVPAVEVQDGTVKGRPAAYAHGAWDGNHRWMREADAGVLSWQDDDFVYVLQHGGLGLARDDVLRVAESFQ